MYLLHEKSVCANSLNSSVDKETSHSFAGCRLQCGRCCHGIFFCKLRGLNGILITRSSLLKENYRLSFAVGSSLKVTALVELCGFEQHCACLAPGNRLQV